jgi:transposase
MTGSIPMLSERQWRAIEPLLAENRRDRVVIAAVLFRHTTAMGLRDVAEQFGMTRTRLADWDAALRRDGSLPKLLKVLRLKPANALQWDRRPNWGRSMQADVLRYRLDQFDAELARTA